MGLGLGGLQVEEFRTTLGPRISGYFIADLKRSWWNDGRIEDAIDAAIAHALDRNPRIRFVVLGNSMGGSGAILAAHIRPQIERAVAFAPQADVRLSAGEKRWMAYRRRITAHRWPTFLLHPARADLRIVFGDLEDAFHRRLYVRAGLPVVDFGGIGHDVVRELRDDRPDEYAKLLDFLLKGAD